MMQNVDGVARGNPESNEMFGVYLMPGPTVAVALQSLAGDGAHVYGNAPMMVGYAERYMARLEVIFPG